MMNKIRWIALSLALVLLTGCGGEAARRERIVTVTILPQQFFARQIAGDLFEVRCMVPQGSSPESYDPTPSDLVGLNKSMAYFKVGYLGYELAWMDRIAKGNRGMKIYDCSDGAEMITGGHACSDPSHQHHTNYDPHLWSSPVGARSMIANMVGAFCELDSANAALYRENAAKLVQYIDSIDTEVQFLTAMSPSKTFAIYHPALGYFARDYGLKQISLEHEGKEPSVAHLAQLSDELKREQVKVVFVQQEFDQKNAELLAREGQARIVKINPLRYDWGEEMVAIAKALCE